MKNSVLISSFVAFSLLFSADAMAGKNKRKKRGHHAPAITRKAPQPKNEEMSIIPKAPPLPTSVALVERKSDEKQKKKKTVISMAKDAKQLLKASSKTVKAIAQGNSISVELLNLRRQKLNHINIVKPPSFVSPEMQLLQSVVLRSVPLEQKPRAIGGEQVRQFSSLLAQRRGEELEKELSEKANAGLKRRRLCQLIKEKSEDPQHKAFLTELLNETRKRREVSQEVSESVIMERSWIEVPAENDQSPQNKAPSQTSWYWKIIGYK